MAPSAVGPRLAASFALVQWTCGSQGVDNGELLRQLKIDRGHREAVNTAPVRWPWIVGGVLLALLALGIGGWWMLANRAVVVQPAAAAAPGGGDTGAVLQAICYVTARRQATVSAQITGTLTDGRIEEGDHVSKGHALSSSRAS